ncbi:MAG: hypothetical protein ACREF4_09530, partial [Gammaproteobacteria bacterium]
MSTELDIEQILAEATPMETEVALCVRGDLNFRHQQLVEQLATAGADERQTLAAQIGAAEDEMRA